MRSRLQIEGREIKFELILRRLNRFLASGPRDSDHHDRCDLLPRAVVVDKFGYLGRGQCQCLAINRHSMGNGVVKNRSLALAGVW